MRTLYITVCLLLSFGLVAQLKFLIEDFEGFDKGGRELGESGFFAFGGLKQDIDGARCNSKPYSGNRCLKISKAGRAEFGGWGKGVSLNMELDQRYDNLNFYVFSEKSNNPATFRIELQEDDNADGQYKKEK